MFTPPVYGSQNNGLMKTPVAAVSCVVRGTWMGLYCIVPSVPESFMACMICRLEDPRCPGVREKHAEASERHTMSFFWHSFHVRQSEAARKAQVPLSSRACERHSGCGRPSGHWLRIRLAIAEISLPRASCVDSHWLSLRVVYMPPMCRFEL